jgi:cytoskeletal protein CcmA (bactofilin family)
MNRSTTTSSKTLTVQKNQTVDGAFYGAGDLIEIDGKVKGDVYCAGQNIIINGTVDGDVICAGQTIRVAGTVNGDVRVAGQSISVDGAITGSVSAFGQNITVSENTTIGRDFNGAGQSVVVSGKVGRDMGFASNQANVTGHIGRNFNGYYENATIASGATVAGNAIFESRSAAIANGAVSGETKRTTPVIDTEQRAAKGFDVIGRIFNLLALFTFALVLVLFVPGHVRRATNVSMRQFWLSALLGFGITVGAPIVAIILAFTLIGIPLAGLLVLGWLGLLMLSIPVFSYYIGRQLLRTNPRNAVAVMAIGALVVLLVMNIPLLGGLVGFVGSVAGVGMVAMALSRRWTKPVYTPAV